MEKIKDLAFMALALPAIVALSVLTVLFETADEEIPVINPRKNR